MSEENKTIAKLNEKIWYRLLKVIYILALLFVIIFFVADAFESKPKKVFDGYNTTINCEGGTAYKAGENDIFFISATDSGKQNQLKELCMSGKFPDMNFEIFKKTSERLDGNPINYTIDYAYKDVGSWGIVIGNALSGIFVMIIVFEIIRRIFYYIVLGKIFPKKK